MRAWIRFFPASVWIFALMMALMLSLPYLIGLMNTPEGWQYSGAAAVGQTDVDFNSHLAKMGQGARGEWAYRLLFTHEPHRGLIGVQGFYVTLGALAGFFSISLPLLYHLARFLLTAGMILAIWSFAARFFPTNRERWLALIFGTVVWGWSWLLLILDPAQTRIFSPIEFWLIDAFHLFGALYMPHFAAAVLLQIIALLAFDSWLAGRNRSWNLFLLTISLALDAFIQPYVVLLMLPLIGLLTLKQIFHTKTLRFQTALRLAIPLGLHGLLTLYQALAIGQDPVWADFTRQNITHSPPPVYYLLGYLPFLLPIGFGISSSLRKSLQGRWWMPVLWVGLVAILLYAPLPTQRRYLLGLQTPLAILAAWGWPHMTRFLNPRRRFLLTTLYVIFGALPALAIFASNISALANPLQNSAVYYQPDERAGYDWLRDNADRDEVVLTTFDWSGQGSGGKLVGALGQRVFIGHWIETVDFTAKIEQARRFYQNETSEEWRADFLEASGIRYIWYDPHARKFGPWNPAEANHLTRVFDSDTVQIFRVERGP